MRRGLAAAAASAVVALSFGPLFATSAGAQTQGSVTVTQSGFALSPARDAGGNVQTDTLFVDGKFHAAGGLQPSFDWVVVNLLWMGPTPAPPAPPPYTICGYPPNNAPKGSPCSGADVDLAHHLLAPAPSYNGPYRVNATGHAIDQLGAAQPNQASTPNIDFGINAPPLPATTVTATVDSKTRDVTVSWDRNATDPDVQSYWIWRKGPGDADFKAVKQTPQLKSGARISVPDTDPACKAGDYTYEIETHRNGATGDPHSTVVSDRSKSASPKATVPSGPPCTTTPPTSPPAGGGGAPPVVTGTPSGVSHSSSFSGSSSGSGSSALANTPTTESVTPDPGFVRGLPYAGSNANDQNSSEGDNSAVAVTPGRHKSAGKGILVPVAGAAVLLLGALHLRYFKKRLDEPPGTGLTPVT